MEVKLLLVFVICQIITGLSGFTLPLQETIGIATPIQPKSPSFSAETSPITKSPLIWDGEDVMPKLLPPAAPGLVFRQFSSPITFTSSSKSLPVPRIDKSSIKDVKMPERLGKRFIANDFSRNVTPYTLPPRVSLPYKNPLWSSPTTLPASSSYISPDIYSAVPNRLSSVSSLQSLPPVPLEPYLPSKTNTFAPPISKAISTPNFLTPSSLPFHPANSLPYPLYYKSMYLPGVRTPEQFPYYGDRLSYTETLNFNAQSPTNTFSLLNPVSEINKLPLPFLNPVELSGAPEPPKPTNIAQTPKIPNNIPSSGFSLLNSEIRSRTKPGIESSMASMSFKPESPNSISSAVGTSNTPFFSPKIGQEKPLFPFQSSKVQSTPFEIDVLQNCTKTFDNSKSFSRNKPNIYPSADTWLNNRETLSPYHASPYYGENVINPYIIIPDVTPFSSSLATEEILFLPPTIPFESIPTSYYPASSFPPISHTPSISTSISQSISTTAPSFSDIVSNFTEQLLCSCKSYLKSITQNVKASIYSKINPYAYPGLEPQPSLPRVNPLQANAVLPNLNSPIHSTKTPAVDFSTFTSFNSPVLEMASSDLSPVSSSPSSTVTNLSPFRDISSPCLNPSYLPSPALPSSLFCKESPIKSASKKDSDERLLESMMIAEILDDDDSFDWDDLDAFLTLLSLT